MSLYACTLFVFWYFHECNTECFIFSKFIYVNYNATFHFSKKESAYIAGSVYMVSMLFGPVMGLIVVSHSKHITVKLLKPGHLEKSLPVRTTLEQRKVIFFLNKPMIFKNSNSRKSNKSVKVVIWGKFVIVEWLVLILNFGNFSMHGSHLVVTKQVFTLSILSEIYCCGNLPSRSVSVEPVECLHSGVVSI